MKKQHLWIFVLVVLLLLAFVGQALVMRMQKSGDTVCIYRDDTLLYELPLHEDKTLTIPYGDEGYNTVVIKDGAVSVTDASCPDHVCAKHKPTNETADPIVCLPNHLIIQIEREEPSQLDGVSS